jgi:hypothetical protein
MFGSLKTWDIQAIRDFKGAQRTYDNITPIRGKSVRPIGDRRAQHKQIVQESLDGVNAYACRLYQTNCVTFLEDGRIFIDHGNYTTKSTKDFINAVLARASVSCPKGDFLIHVPSGHYHVPEGGLYLDQDLKPINPAPCVVHKINRKGSKAVRARYTPFIEYALGLVKLTEGKFEAKTDRRANWDEVAECMRSDEPEDMWSAISQILYFTGTLCYYNSQYTRVVTEDSMARGIEKVLLNTHADEMLVAETLPLGQWKHDKYGKYVK